MDISKKRWLIVLGIVLLIGLIIIALVLGWFSRRGKAFDSRPLVLIHDPGYDDFFQIGDGVLVHATAREDNGLKRIELWANDKLIDAVDAEEPTTNLVLYSTWIPTYEGEHQIIARAFSTDDISGQSTIIINVVAADQVSTGFHIVKEGDTLESIADEYGSSPEEIEELNPEIGDGSLAPGDELFIPDDDPGSDGSPPAPEGEGEGEGDGDAPSFAGETPLMDSPFSISDMIPSRERPVVLRVEVPRIQTGNPFDRLHCYVGLGESLPQWYPDRDANQATDETFEALGDGWWNTEGILLGDAAPLIIWPHDQALTGIINCVGVAGGTEAVELGRINLRILPEQWNGIRRAHEVDGEGGHLMAEVRVTRLLGSDIATPKYLDPDMAVPSNLRLDEDARMLWWDYPEEEEENIIGFEIFLNGNLIWTEGAFRRDSRMPAEWFHPPCGSTYVFGVRAYRWDSDLWMFAQSRTAEIELIQPERGCQRQLQITFLSLETFNLGGDGSHEDRHGDVGPAFGGFYANGARFNIDQGREGSGLDMPDGLRHYTLYDLAAVAADPAWRSGGANANIVYTDLAEDATLRVGFAINDRDTGRCRDSDDPGCPDRICRGVHAPLYDGIVNFDEIFTSTIRSDNDRCEVRFEIRPGPESPVGVAGTGGEPLPWLELDEYTLDDDTGNVSLYILNSGTAGWSQHDLTIGLRTRDGREINDVTFFDLEIPVGDVAALHHPELFVPPPFDFCVVIDPYDEVLELHERTGALSHTLICPEVPDLDVQDAYFERLLGNRMSVQVQNIGVGDLVDRTMSIEVRSPAGELLFDPMSYHGVSIDRWETHRFELTPISDGAREAMYDGYTVTLNPDHSVIERSYENNSFTVGEGTRMAINLMVLNVPEPATDVVRYHIDGYIRTGRIRNRQVLDFDIAGNHISWTCDDTGCSEVFYENEHLADWFEIYGDEDFEIVINIEHVGTRAGGGSLLDDFTLSHIYQPPRWGAGGPNPADGTCYYHPLTSGGNVHGGRQFRAYDWADRRWRLYFDFCRENFAE